MADMIANPAFLDDMSKNKQLRSYDSVTDLGLTSGSATMLQIWDALPESSILFFTSNELASADRPTSADSFTVMVCKRGTYRGYIVGFSKGAYSVYTMGLYGTTYNGNDSNKPSGEWISLSSYAVYATCSTEATTQVKEVTTALRGNTLVTGIKLFVKFDNAQNYNGQPQLKVNSCTATNIVRYGSTAAARYEWRAGEVVEFVYDGTNFVMLGGLANTTYYGKTRLSYSLTSTSTSLAATANAVNKVNTKVIGDWTLLTDFTTDGGGDYGTAITIPSSAREIAFGYGNSLAPVIVQVNFFNAYSNAWLSGIYLFKYNIMLNKTGASKIGRIAVRQWDGSTVGDAANNNNFHIWYR